MFWCKVVKRIFWRRQNVNQVSGFRGRRKGKEEAMQGRVEGSRMEQSYEQHKEKNVGMSSYEYGDGEKNPGLKVRRSIKYLMFLTFCFFFYKVE